jgi:AcrR family transcriptional regulator
VPKKVDHEARRLELAEALWRITRKYGWDAVSLRRVAAEASVSMGMVQHYFSTKDEMLRFAMEMITDDTRRRIRSRVAELPEPRSPRRLVGTVLSEMIPRPDRRATEAEAAAVFVRRFMLKPESATEFVAGGVELKQVLAEQIRLSRATGQETAPDAPDPVAGRGGRTRDAAERDAGGLIALLEGLILNIVTGQQTSETAQEILDTQLDYVFGRESA